MHFSYKYFRNLIVFILLLITTLITCTSPKNKSTLHEYSPVFQSIIKSNTGAFRGFSLGDKLDSVKTKETALLTEADEYYLYYEAKIDDTTGYYNVSYTFDETGLNEIQSDIFIKNINFSDTIYNQLKTYFEKSYGPSEAHGGFDVWSVESEKYGKIQINLSDESSDFTTDNEPGKISIWIYPNKE